MPRIRLMAIIAPAVLCSMFLVQPAQAGDIGFDPARGPVIDANGVSFPGYYDGIGGMTKSIEDTMVAYPDVYGGVRFDHERVAHVVGMFDGATAERAGQARSALARITTTHGIRILTEPSKYALAERQGVADEIFENHKEWSERIGATVRSVNVVPATGEVVVGVDEEIAPRAVNHPGDVPVTVETVKISLQAGNRRDDRGYWTGGNWLAIDPRPSTSLPNCTMGFTWRKWGVGGAFGGLALHCVRGTGAHSWWHNGRHLGTFAYSASASDSALLAPAPGTGFSPTVWVGGPTTTVERTVVGANPAPTRDTYVALSGARSGLNTFTVIDERHDVVGLGPLVLTNAATCDDGDSGGPWLTTLGAYPNNVIAHGQHVGEVTMMGGFRSCAYLPVHHISAALSASILTG